MSLQNNKYGVKQTYKMSHWLLSISSLLYTLLSQHLIAVSYSAIPAAS